MYKQLIKPILFSTDPETIHHRVFSLIKTAFKLPGAGAAAGALYRVDHPGLRRSVFGIDFPNPVGLAAGLDKNAILFNELAGLGYGFIEIGTLTPRPQPGNPQPRLFRLPQDEALINRMGFNNEGVEAAVHRLKKKRPGVIVGGNIGKNKTTPNEEAVKDYLLCFHALYDYVDYFVVNVSSPNTPGLRELQEKGPLTAILRALKQAGPANSQKPVLLKIAPDLSNSQLDDIMEIVQATGTDGIIATNTTISREGLQTAEEQLNAIGAGGLSGKPLAKRATEVIRYLVEKSGNAFPVIGVGGIHSPGDALEKLEAGASLVQLYTGFIYEGPGLIKRINKAILSKAGRNEKR
ncbi:dihydroorotate oxidase A [Anseongella ginsenosidimutans]|uniref:Dihydroorotate dehydrogenase (quinone) n=1 Tax=Anseongella ginsenosidimutans TaxID=496056 RepID=A0A4R3KQR0_9SPHI|nr:quinone-dependent dihydroorotate dehydrogenase [Anseongella ginsenosidimutans]QEC52837.1 quinone-dependent dihydroorotate dehydrogenase [Anseongella ginsenosidimutans]TCS87220.1 dihydroorotate oxidase A [Anseongella ginsenosidimutans]